MSGRRRLEVVLARVASSRTILESLAGLGHRKAAVAHERVDPGVTAAERPVGIGPIHGVAHGEQVVDQPPGHVLVIEPARRLGERLGRVGGAWRRHDSGATRRLSEAERPNPGGRIRWRVQGVGGSVGT